MAIGACGAIYEILVGFALGVGNGLSIVTARSFGAKDENLLKNQLRINRNRNLLTIILMLFHSFVYIRY
ncbi:MAG: MATE family efflux transporter [Thomasclavelia ramosa]